jgi:hypothetical protein
MDDYHVPAKRAKFDIHNKNLDYHKTQEPNRNIQNDDLWGDDFNEEDIEEMDLIASQACVQVLIFKIYYTFFSNREKITDCSLLHLKVIQKKFNCNFLSKLKVISISRNVL